jgi:hypothetical protein
MHHCSVVVSDHCDCQKPYWVLQVFVTYVLMFLFFDEKEATLQNSIPISYLFCLWILHDFIHRNLMRTNGTD